MALKPERMGKNWRSCLEGNRPDCRDDMVKTGARRQQCLRLFLCPGFIMLLPQRFHDASSTQPLMCMYSVGASRIDLDQREYSRKGEWLGWWEEICVDMETRKCTRPGGGLC